MAQKLAPASATAMTAFTNLALAVTAAIGTARSRLPRFSGVVSGASRAVSGELQDVISIATTFGSAFV